jgi:hypothetical protein
MDSYTPPSPVEIARVAEYWRRVKALGCNHESLTFDGAHPDLLVCGGECGRPIHILSDFQLEERLKPKAMTDNVRDDIIRQLDRGGVEFTADGERHEVRLHICQAPDLGQREETVCIEVEHVQRLLRATEGRDV